MGTGNETIIVIFLSVIFGLMTLIIGLMLAVINRLVNQLDYTNRLILSEKLFSVHGTEGLKALNTISKMRGITTPTSTSKIPEIKPLVEDKEGITFIQQSR